MSFDDVNRSDLILLNCLGYIQAGDFSEPREKCVKPSMQPEHCRCMLRPLSTQPSATRCTRLLKERAITKKQPTRELML